MFDSFELKVAPFTSVDLTQGLRSTRRSCATFEFVVYLYVLIRYHDTEELLFFLCPSNLAILNCKTLLLV